MRKIFYILFVILISGCFLTREKFDVERKTPKFKWVPPGTRWLRDNLFMDEAEITLTDYREFLYWTSRCTSKSYYQSLLPDTLVWRKFGILKLDTFMIKPIPNGSLKTIQYKEDNIYERLYFRHPAYSNYPVVGISYWQAQEYCKWRTDRVNEYLAVKRGEWKWQIYPDSNVHWKKVVNYRLPTKEEWEYAAAAGLDFIRNPMGYESITDKHYYPVSVTQESGTLYHKWSYKHGNDSTVEWNSQYFPEPVFYGKANKYGLYNMLGNVSEIIADSMYKGLNYLTPIITRQNDSIYSIYNYKQTWKYTKPEAWLGFRCICEIIE